MFAKFKFKPTVKISKNILIITAISLSLLCSLGFNVALTYKNSGLNQRLENLLSENTLTSKNFNLKIDALNAELTSAKEELKTKITEMELEVQAAASQAAKCLPLMKKYGVK